MALSLLFPLCPFTWMPCHTYRGIYLHKYRRKNCSSTGDMIVGFYFLVWASVTADFALAKRVVPNKPRANMDGVHIGCAVCNKAMDALYTSVAEARREAPYNKLDEGKIQEIVESVCKNDEPGGEWIRRLDITEHKKDKGTFLQLSEPGGVSKCGEECKTITKSCQDLFSDEVDADDLSAMLWKNKKTPAEGKKTVCREWAERCSKKERPIDYERADLPFVPMSDKDLQMEQLMAQMKAAGMGGMSMYNRDDMENMAGGGMGGMGGYEDYGDYADAMGGAGGDANEF